MRIVLAILALLGTAQTSFGYFCPNCPSGWSGGGARPTITATRTSSRTFTPTPTFTATPTPTITNTPTRTPTRTLTQTATVTPTPSSTFTPTNTFTHTPTLTATAAPQFFAQGCYTGNSTDNRQITVPFQPEWVMVEGFDATAKQWLKTKDIAGDVAYDMFDDTYTATADRIQALNSTGFEIGGSTAINNNGATYCWVAFREKSGSIKIGTYTGNDSSPRAFTGFGFNMSTGGNLLITELATSPGNQRTWYKNYLMAATRACSFWVNGSSSCQSTAALITSFDSDGFTAGSAYNNLNVPVVYLAVADDGVLVDVGQYTGNGSASQAVDTGCSTTIDAVFTRADNSGVTVECAAWRPRALDALDNTGGFCANSANTDGYFDDFSGDDFTVITSNENCNVNAITHYYFAMCTP